MPTDPIIQKYIDLIKANTSAFKVFYSGDPIRVPVSELPCLIVAKVDTRVKNMSSSEDEHQIRLSFTVITDIRATFSEDMHMVAGVNQLYNLMEGRQDTTYQLKTDSLLYILRHNVELDPAQNLRTGLNTMSTVNYGLTMGKRQEGAWSIEGTLDIICNFSQPR